MLATKIANVNSVTLTLNERRWMRLKRMSSQSTGVGSIWLDATHKSINALYQLAGALPA